jgi:hypothetical protein
MDRRSFLSAATAGTGALGAAVTMPAWLSGCGASAPHIELGVRETDTLLARLDAGLATVAAEPSGGLTAAQPWHVRPELGESMLRLGTQALVVADVARSIPTNVRVPDALRLRLLETLPVLDDCTAQYHHLLSSTPAAVRRRVDRRFRADPDTAMNVASYLDTRGSALGISGESRIRLRSNATHVTTRIRRQSASAMIDDCIAKVEATVARSGGSVAALRGAAASGFVDAMWQAVDGDPGGSALAPPPPPPGYVSTSSGVVVPAPAPVAAYEPPSGAELETGSESPGDTELLVGGVLVGGGVAVFGIATLIGFAAGNAGLGALIGATPGGALVITGIILLIVGAVQNANAD